MKHSAYKIVIPSRFDSSRLPGKPLLDIAGKPMIEWVYRQAKKTHADEIIVATDDQRIFDCVLRFGGKAEMTASDHESGTDRIAEVARKRNWGEIDTIVNLQGDEPLMNPALVDSVAESLQHHPDCGIATAATEITNSEEIFDPNVVKTVLNHAGEALYFSRAPIPWDRNNFSQTANSTKALEFTPPVYRHLGLYAYRNETLNTLTTLPPSQIEQVEALEQLRALSNGIRIYVHLSDSAPAHGVDTEEDLQRVRKILARC